MRQIAETSLRQNIITLPSGVYLTAGQHQFKTLWTRDFCYSIRGLLKIGRADVVKHQLEVLILERRGSDGLVPRVLDSGSVQTRVILSSVNIILPLHDPLKPYYLDEHGSEAIDSNALVLLGALEYRNATGDEAWWKANLEGLVQIFQYYVDHKRSNGLLFQSSFSDWQDSVNRKGATFYANLLYYRVLALLADDSDFGIKQNDTEVFKSHLQEIFWDPNSGLYRSIEVSKYRSIEVSKYRE